MSGGLYSILGVSRSASKDTIRVAYLRLAKQLHPDVNKSTEAVQKFQRVREAYEVLSDEVRRREHDRQLEARGLGSATASSSSSAGPRQRERRPPEAPFGAGQSQSYWEVYERARKAEQRTAAWHHRTQQQGYDDFSRANAQFREAFDRERYRQRLAVSVFRMVPFLAPVWFIVFLMTLRGTRTGGQGQPVTFDSFGRAYMQDAFGKLHRMPDFDRQE
mmetsp:Transcript_15337/g.45959  ORF Transcript_15337/g.45959 Transcript_15337/m.45959 type:complete len:218 (+) Transcript_15337:31-684(+)